VIFTAEIAIDVEVEVLDATRATAGRVSDRPERCTPAEPAGVELAVRLWRDQVWVDLTPALPADVLEALRADALERLSDAADAERCV
jgi:hypothetical protein